jgi:3-deoxy-manno-octulosonate cytidylyltransferase (CMP-KDO synthetase)
MSEFHVLIPARLDSTRLPDKALADVAGRAMIVRVWERAVSAGPDSVHVATDSEAIAEAVRAAGGRVVMTGAAHASGTSRIAEAAGRLGLDASSIVVNLQGDEPAVPVACIHQLVALLADDASADMATLYTGFDEHAQWRDPNAVKLVVDHSGRALYFSRAAIPARRNGAWPDRASLRHVGLYAYRAGALARWSDLPDSELAELESLEQLRPLQAGWTIRCARAAEPVPPGVDTAEDLEAMRQRFSTESLQPKTGASG